MFGLHGGQGGLRAGAGGREASVEKVEALGGKKAGREGWTDVGRNSHKGRFLDTRCRMLRMATLRVMFHVFFDNLFLPHRALSASASRVHFATAAFVLGLT